MLQVLKCRENQSIENKHAEKKTTKKTVNANT